MPLTDARIKQAKPSEKVQKLSDGKGLRTVRSCQRAGSAGVSPIASMVSKSCWRWGSIPMSVWRRRGTRRLRLGSF